MQQYKNNVTLRLRNPLIDQQNGLKCNISSITAQKLCRRDANHILIRFWVLTERPDTNYMQQFKNNMTLRPRNPLFDPQNELKHNISSVTAQICRQNDVNHILIRFWVLLERFDTIYMQAYTVYFFKNCLIFHKSWSLTQKIELSW